MREQARSLKLSIAIALAAVYLPQLVPLLTTDLLDSPHCLGVYVQQFPVLVGLAPGISARIASGVGEPTEEWLRLGVQIAVTAFLLGVTICTLRWYRRAGVVVAIVTTLLSVALSMAAVAMIRA